MQIFRNKGSLDAYSKLASVDACLSLTINISVTVSSQLEFFFVYSEKKSFYVYLFELPVSHYLIRKSKLSHSVRVYCVFRSAGRRQEVCPSPTSGSVSQLMQSAVNVSTLIKWDYELL